MIEPVKVESSNLDFVGFREHTLYVQFKHGGSYAYSGVDRKLYQSMTTSESVGKFFNEFIKKAYPFTKLEYDPFAVS